MKVLVIEDQALAAMQLAAALKMLGHETELIGNGADASRRLSEARFPVVVSDWRLPGMDGLDVCRMVRARGGDYVYFILVSTAGLTRENREAALAAGVDDFLAKPVDPDELRMRLHVAERILSFTAQVKQLESFLPICSYCKKIRDDKNYWAGVEEYYAKRGTRFSHGVCPGCYEDHVRPQLAALGIDTTTITPPEAGPRCERTAGE